MTYTATEMYEVSGRPGVLVTLGVRLHECPSNGKVINVNGKQYRLLPVKFTPGDDFVQVHLLKQSELASYYEAADRLDYQSYERIKAMKDKLQPGMQASIDLLEREARNCEDAANNAEKLDNYQTARDERLTAAGYRASRNLLIELAYRIGIPVAAKPGRELVKPPEFGKAST